MASACCCQPEADSPVNVVLASRVPVAGPDPADVGAGLAGVLVEPDRRELRGGGDLDLDAQLERPRAAGAPLAVARPRSVDGRGSERVNSEHGQAEVVKPQVTAAPSATPVALFAPVPTRRGVGRRGERAARSA